ncbi:MAG: TSUP family transporter [bacterium]
MRSTGKTFVPFATMKDDGVSGMQAILAIVIGLAAGVLGGLMGVGGGIIIVPALTLFFQMTQHKAQGTSLGVLLLPIGILGVWKYWQKGDVDLALVGWIAAGFVIGALFGSMLVQRIPDIDLKRYFGIFLLLVSLQMIFGKR